VNKAITAKNPSFETDDQPPAGGLVSAETSVFCGDGLVRTVGGYFFKPFL